MASDEQIEKEIKERGLTAPRVTPDHIEACIVAEYYFTAGQAIIAIDGDLAHSALDVLTFCVIVLKNGFTVTGESACASPENYRADIGDKIARQNAVDKIWVLEGYLLKDRLSQQ